MKKSFVGFVCAKVARKYGPTEMEMLSDNPQAPRLMLIEAPR